MVYLLYIAQGYNSGKGGAGLAPIIHTEKLRKVYAVGKERVVALNNIDLNIEKGEFCCIVGQSGSGKSTLLNQLAGLEKPTKGKVFIGRHEISAMTETELARFRQEHLGFIFQSYNLLPTMTAAENVALPLMFKGVAKKERLRRARADERLAAVAGRMHLQPGEATLVLGQLPQAPHLVYLDPMFPAKGKAALTKKKLQLFQRLEPPCAQEEELLAAALAAGPRRVVVKRPLKAPALAGRKPSHSVEGKTIRYDVFVPAR